MVAAILTRKEHSAVMFVWHGGCLQVHLGQLQPAPPNIIAGSHGDTLVPAEVGLGYSLELPPVLFGHYWFSGQPSPLAPNVACLDYSVAKGEKLCAYRWSGESVLSENNFVYV